MIGSTSGEHTNKSSQIRGEGSSLCGESTSGEHANKQPDERGTEESSYDKSTSGEDANRQPDERGEGSSSRDKRVTGSQMKEVRPALHETKAQTSSQIRDEGSSSHGKSTNSKHINKQP